MHDPTRQTNELILTDGQQVFLRDNTSGVIEVFTGPISIQHSGRQQTPVVYDHEDRNYRTVEDPYEAVENVVVANRNQYVLLQNPSSLDNRQHPASAAKGSPPVLKVGETQVIPGPCSFALWPGQDAEVIDGHSLRSNEYVLIEVVDEEATRTNWAAAMVKKVAKKTEEPATRTELKKTEGGEIDPDAPVDEVVQAESVVLSADVPEDLAVGSQYTIAGTDVRFYMPPTGVRVVPDSQGNYVQPALTLEIMEYAILVDENGEKTYPRGPCVVFPKPTERFITSKDGNRAFRPIELNHIQGVHLKALGDHEFNGTSYSEGDEFFLTGKEARIYYPHPLHALVKYDGRSKHFAVCVPEGQSRYVLDRNSGDVKLVKGSTMLLPNPVDEVIVRRVLSERESDLWYPGNETSQDVNNALRAALAETPTTRTGTVSEGQAERASRRRRGSKGLRSSMSQGMEASNVSYGASAVAEEISRGSTFTEPRTVTLDTKYAGAPVIEPWPGYAVMIVDKQGSRRVETGPARIHLEYGETLQSFVVSTGRPKTAKKLHHDVYLRTANNSVRDEIDVTTKDHVDLKVYCSFRAGFEGDTAEERLKWWSVENYVRFMTDHIRSRLKAAIRKIPLSQFYAEPADHIRDILLGEATPNEDGTEGKRPGLAFSENNLRVYDVEVLEVKIADRGINEHLITAMRTAVVTELTLGQTEVQVAALEKQSELHAKEVDLRKGMADRDNQAVLEDRTRKGKVLEADQALEQTRIMFSNARQKAAVDLELEIKSDRLEQAKDEEDQRIAFRKQDAEIDKSILDANTAATVTRYEAAQGPLTEALVALGDRRTMVDMAEATSIQRFIGGKSVADAFTNMFGEDIAGKLAGLGGRAFGKLDEIRGTVRERRTQERPVPEAK